MSLSVGLIYKYSTVKYINREIENLQRQTYKLVLMEENNLLLFIKDTFATRALEKGFC